MMNNVHANSGTDDLLEAQWSAVSDALKVQGYNPGSRCCLFTSASVVTGLALFVIGCVAAAGAFPGSAALGWTAIGLGAGTLALSLALGKLKLRRCELIGTSLQVVAIVAVGALGVAGVLSATQLGWAIVGIPFASIPVNCFFNCLKKAEIAEQSSSDLVAGS